MTQQENQLQRIARMEQIYDQNALAVEELLRALEQYRTLQPSFQELEAYYLGPSWREDFIADRDGQIPKDTKRGILTEDAIYDLLIDNDWVRKNMKALLEE